MPFPFFINKKKRRKMKSLIICLMLAAMFMLSSCSVFKTKSDAVVFSNPCCGIKMAIVEEDVPDVKIIIMKNVMFDWDKDVIRSDQQRVIDDIAQTMIDNTDLRIILDGYASVEGDEDYNLKLSNRRVDAVKSALVSKCVPADRIVNAEGQGETDIFGLDILWKNRKVVIMSE